MTDPVSPLYPNRRRLAVLIPTTLACGFFFSCDQIKEEPQKAAIPASETSPLLAAARVDLANERLESGFPDEALPMLVAALKADPASVEAREMAADILASTRWNLPEMTIRHGAGFKIDRIEFSPPSSLWVGLISGTSTMVRWNLETGKIESVLFPIACDGIRSFVPNTQHQRVVMERAGVLLLFDSLTLKPIRDLGTLPDFVTPSSTIVFSQDGLLLAHPAWKSSEDHSVRWYLRDTVSGEIIRRSDPAPADRAKPMAAFLDRTKLRVLHADGGIFEMPVSPVEVPTFTPSAAPLELLHATFSENGGSALTLQVTEAHRQPELHLMSAGGDDHSSLEPRALLERYSWNRHPGLWSGLLSAGQVRPIHVKENTARLTLDGEAPIQSDFSITALAIHDDLILVGDEKGDVIFHRSLPLPILLENPPEHAIPDEHAITALGYLTEFLTGRHDDGTSRTFPSISAAKRLESLRNCDFTAITRMFPNLDFSPIISKVESFKQVKLGPESTRTLDDRLAAAAGLDATAFGDMQTAFENADDDAVAKSIEAAGNQGPAAAMALEFALASTRPGWIKSVLAGAEDLPPLVHKLAVSRIAWLEDRKADAIAGWPDAFPDLPQVRLREDWHGWEQADFGPALEKLRLCVAEELDAIKVPDNSTPEQRKALYERLVDPKTVTSVGKPRFAKACLNAALAFSAHKDETATTFHLASIARNLGEAPEPCLRAEALALTALGDYQNARDRWITLITEHPVDTHLPGDYAEAAYTSFENADPRQAMEILTTGLHRFPNDANFALRAGWVALLTGNSERAYRFLLTGRQIGYPDEKLENAVALMAIAAVQTGATEDAGVFYQELIRMDPAWENPETIETLAWPEELKSSLRQLVW